MQTKFTIYLSCVISAFILLKKNHHLKGAKWVVTFARERHKTDAVIKWCFVFFNLFFLSSRSEHSKWQES